jgi:hypothetical protein
MLEFCAKHDIVPDAKTIATREIETAFSRMAKNDVKYRLVIDIATMDKAAVTTGRLSGRAPPSAPSRFFNSPAAYRSVSITRAVKRMH